MNKSVIKVTKPVIMTTEMELLKLILRELKALREDFAKFQRSVYKKDKDGETWVTASILRKKFNVSYRQLEHYRRVNVIKFKQVRPGVVRYLLSSAEAYFKQ